MSDDKRLIESLLAELHYILECGDIRDSEKNSVDIRNEAARRLGFQSYAAYSSASKDF